MIEELYKVYKASSSVQTDTRKLKAGEMFFALKGPNFNGNEYAQQAIDKGASCAVIDEAAFEIPHKTILVEDVMTTLQQLAHYHRKQFYMPVIAITGSNGKTTTKELIHKVLSTSYQVYTTEGNLNNHIGVPLTILKIKPDAEIAVIEMGANHPGEIAAYCKIADPTHGIITNCGKAHLEGFGSLEGVKKAKGELYDYLREKEDRTAFVMWDYDYLRKMSEGIAMITTYGTSNTKVCGKVKELDPFLQVACCNRGDQACIKTQLVGAYNLPNVLAALAVGFEMKISFQKIRRAIEQYKPDNSRSQMVDVGSNKIILDAYNANPGSMKAAIENFAAMKADKKILILGEMAEMGGETKAEHKALVSLVQQYPWEEVVLVGKAFEPFRELYRYFKNVSDARVWFQEQNFENTFFLIKGSRSAAMEKILE